MGKAIVVLASGETERRALPHLLADLRTEEIVVVEVRIPPAGRALNVDMAEKLLKASWFEKTSAPPDKFVILVDTDGKDPEEMIRPFREELSIRVANIKVHIQFAYAEQHLEAWYFADISGLREYLERDTGNVDASKPDEIQNPKLHLKHLLGERAYTAVVSEEIAKKLNMHNIAERSPSFQVFLRAVRNGNESGK